MQWGDPKRHLLDEIGSLPPDGLQHSNEGRAYLDESAEPSSDTLCALAGYLNEVNLGKIDFTYPRRTTRTCRLLVYHTRTYKGAFTGINQQPYWRELNVECSEWRRFKRLCLAISSLTPS